MLRASIKPPLPPLQERSIKLKKARKSLTNVQNVVIELMVSPKGISLGGQWAFHRRATILSGSATHCFNMHDDDDDDDDDNVV